MEAKSFLNVIKSGLAPSIRDLNTFLSLLLRARRLRLFFHLFSNQAASNSLQIDSRTYTLVTRALLKSRRFEEAEIFLLSGVQKRGFCPQNSIWDSLIGQVCTLDGDPNRALILLQECARYCRISPSSITFRRLVMSFCSRGEPESALKVFEIMSREEKGYPVDNFVCSSIISGFSRIRKPELGLQFYDRVKQFDGFLPNLVTYSAVVDALGSVGRSEEASSLVQKMEMEGVKLDSILYDSWISGYLREGNLMEGFRKHRSMLDEGIAPDVVSYTTIIDGLCKEGNVEKAIGFLSEMEKRNIKPNLVTYTSLIGGFCKRNKLDDALCIIKKMEESGTFSDELVCVVLIDSLCKKGDLNRAFGLLEEMVKKGIKDGIVMYNAVINGLCKAGKTSKADKISEDLVADNFTYSTLLHGYMREQDGVSVVAIKTRLENAGISMDIVTCNLLIKALFMIGRVNDACVLFEDMPRMGLVANFITYSTMMDGLCKHGQIDKALDLFHEYAKAVSFSGVTGHNCLIKGLCKEGRIDIAIEVFKDLLEKNIVPDSASYKRLIRAHFKEGGAEGVLKFIHKMEESESKMLSFLCNEAIVLLSMNNCPKTAVGVYMMLRTRGLAVTSKASYTLLKSLLRNGSEEQVIARPLVSECIKMHGIFEPRMINVLIRYLCKKNIEKAILFSNVISSPNTAHIVLRSAAHALKKEGRILEAYNMLIDAKDGLSVDVSAYSIVLDGLSKSGYLEKALDLCGQLAKRGIQPNIIIYNSVINGLCKQGCLVEAFRLYDNLKLKKDHTTVITYDTLISALCREGFFQDAGQLVKSMSARDFAPNTHVYNSLISGYCNSGFVEEALKLLSNLEENCLLPDAFTVGAIIVGYCYRGEIEDALSFFNEYRSKEIFPDFVGFMKLVKGLSAKGRMEEARSILREMFQCPEVEKQINNAGDEIHVESLVSLLSLACDQGRIHEVITILSEVQFMSNSSSHSTSYKRLAQQKMLKTTGASLTEDTRGDSRGAIAHPMEFEIGSKICGDVSNLKTAPGTDTGLADRLADVGRPSDGKDWELLSRKSLHDDFESYYPIIASLCSRGELLKANSLVKAMILNSG